jgi:membrane protease YdiL (CAAX protease family)
LRLAEPRALSLPVPWRNIAIGSLVVALPFLPVLMIYWLVGWLRVEPNFDVRTRRSKLARRFLTPVPLATMEEAVFRGIVLEQLLQIMPQALPYRVLAVVISAILFSSVHFIRRQPSAKPVWQQAYGFFLAGCLFGVGYVARGRNLWVPIALHAWAILMVEIGRLYCKFTDPRWMVGFADSPYSGVIGYRYCRRYGAGTRDADLEGCHFIIANKVLREDNSIISSAIGETACRREFRARPAGSTDPLPHSSLLRV